MNDVLQNGQSIQIPVGDPNVIRTAQFFLDLAKSGKIVGIATIALGSNWEVYSNHTLPVNPAHLHLALGALSSLQTDINDMLRQFKQQMATSPIIKPAGMIR